MENKEVEKKKWWLYVLRYNYSGNYYVGDTENLEKRMLIHLKRISKLPKASWANHSTKGFKYYWFTINDTVSRSEADLLETALTNEFDKVIEELEDNTLNGEIYLRGGASAKDPYPKINPVEEDSLEDDKRHKKIDTYLKKLKEHKLEIKYGEYSIRLLEVGTVGEYKKADCHKDLRELATVEFAYDNKEK